MRILLFMLLCLSSSPGSSGPARQEAGDDPRLARAEQAYREGRYDEAERLWRDLARGPWGEDGRLHYDIGNAAFRQGRLAMALLAYERALRRMPGSEELRFNRDLVLQRLHLPERSGGGLLVGLRRRVETLDAGAWFLLGLAVEALAILLLWRALQRSGRRRWALALSLWGLGLAVQVHATGVDPGRPLGVVVLQDRTPLRSEPRADLEPILRLPIGQRTRWLAGSGDWLRVSVPTPDGPREGWVAGEAAGTW